MPKKDTTETFVAKSISRFGHIIDYSRVKYVSSRIPVELICPIHGSFMQKPCAHLNAKKPCSKCSIGSYSTKQFIGKSKKIHGDIFDYSISDYYKYDSNIKMICYKHGEFVTTPANHFNSNNGGCPGCAPNRQKNSEEFIEDAKKVHGDKYDYSLVKYIKANIKVKIICPKHGVFTQTPGNHLNFNCYKCAGNPLLSSEEFISKSQEIHEDKYDYSLVNYKGMFEKVKIICPDHGRFLVIPTNHLHGKRKCPKCSNRVSKGEMEWLDSLGIPKDSNHRNVHFKINGKRFYVDGYMPNQNTIYEYDGDYWHGNPEFYDQDKMHPEAKVTYRKLYERTINKQKAFEKAGFKVVSIWESDFLSKEQCQE